MGIMGFLDSYMQDKPTSSIKEEPEVKEEPQLHHICSAADSEVIYSRIRNLLIWFADLAMFNHFNLLRSTLTQ